MICTESKESKEEREILSVLHKFRYFLYTFRRNKILSYLKEKGVRNYLILKSLKEFRKCALDLPIVVEFTKDVYDMSLSPSYLEFSEGVGHFYVKSLNLEGLKSSLPPHLIHMAKLLLFFILSHEVVHAIDICTFHALGVTLNGGDCDSFSLSKTLEALSELTPIYLKKFFDANTISVDVSQLVKALDIFVQYHDAVHEIIKMNEMVWGDESVDTKGLLQWYEGAFDHFRECFNRFIVAPPTSHSDCVTMDEDVTKILENVKLNSAPIGINDLIVKCKEVTYNVGVYTWRWELDLKNPWSSSLGIPTLVRVRQRVAPTSVAFLVFLVMPDEPAPIRSFLERAGRLASKLRLYIPHLFTIVFYDKEMQSYLLFNYKDLLKYYEGLSATLIWKDVLYKILKDFPNVRNITKITDVINFSHKTALAFFVISSWNEKIEELVKKVVSRNKPRSIVFVMPTFSKLPPSKLLKKMGAYLVLLGRDETSDVILTPDYLELMERKLTYKDLSQPSLSASSRRT